MITTPATTRPARGRLITDWRPEDPEFWATRGKRIASRNLWFSVLAEHIGFSIWTLWSVMVLFMGPEYGFSAGDKFLLVSTPTLIGGLMRLPYTFAVARFGGRNWTVISAALLLVPTVLAAIVLEPGTSLGMFVLVAALGGVGGGNFASSMANINAFYPDHAKGWALGLNAGGGNLGVAAIQLVGLAVLGTVGAGSPRLVLYLYIPLIVLAAAGAWFRMDNLAEAREDSGAMREMLTERHCLVLSLLYIGTFGSFIGYSFAFGLVLQNEFGRSPLQAAALTFLGPLLGSLSRPLGGLLADRIGGAKVTFATFAAMAAGTGVVIAASTMDSLALFVAGFVVLFILSGLGNGSTYKMIPAVYRRQANADVNAGADADTAMATARRRTGAVIGLAGAIGAIGGLGINLAFRTSFSAAGSGIPAFVAFLGFYALCFAVTWLAYLRAPATTPGRTPVPVS